MTFPSILISGKNPLLISEQIIKISEDLGHQTIPNNPDILEINDYSITSIRTLKTFLSQKPYSHQTKIIIIPDCHQLLVEAQNALLKLLEEPGEGNHFILSTPYKNRLLPTILSRCHQINLSPQLTPISHSPAGGLLISPKSSIKENLNLTDTLPTTKVDALVFLEAQINLYHQQLIQSPTTATANILSRLQKSINLINSNVDPRSAYDYFLLT
ncbi:hypothetical protein KBC75_05715 [Candidatus Shapirobacteria bacterium]|nr:hypothetical protein [Candidatus Shapirobacteria bacterium]